MGRKIQANEDNPFAVAGVLPSYNVNDKVIIDLKGHYDKDEYSFSESVEQKGQWLTGIISENQVPDKDGFYDTQVFATFGGDISWSHEERTWYEIIEAWNAVEGIVRGQRLSIDKSKVVGHENYSTREYTTSKDNDNSVEYASSQENITNLGYKSSVGDINALAYKSSTEGIASTDYMSSSEGPNSRGYTGSEINDISYISSTENDTSAEYSSSSDAGSPKEYMSETVLEKEYLSSSEDITATEYHSDNDKGKSTSYR